jgi:hypothetical protein
VAISSAHPRLDAVTTQRLEPLPETPQETPTEPRKELGAS